MSNKARELHQLNQLMEELGWPYFIWLYDLENDRQVVTGGNLADRKDEVINAFNLFTEEK